MEFAKFHSYRGLVERTRSNASLDNRKGHDMVLIVEGETNSRKPSKKKHPPTTCEDEGVQDTKSKWKKTRKTDDEENASFSESSEENEIEDDGSGSSSGSSDSEADDSLPRGLTLADGSSN